MVRALRAVPGAQTGALSAPEKLAGPWRMELREG